MRIIHVIDSGGLYGAEKVILDLMESGERRNISSILFSLGCGIDGPKPIEVEARQRGLSVVPMRFGKGPNLAGALKIVRKARRANGDIFHSHGYKGDILLGFLPRALRKLPMVSTLHGWTSSRMMSRIWIYERLQTLALKQIDSVVVVSNALIKHPLITKIHVKAEYIANGVPALNFRPVILKGRVKNFSEASKGSFKIVAIGRLSPEKGFDVLIRACALLLNGNYDVQLAIIGEGGEEKALRTLAEGLGIHSRVHFLGYISNAYDLIPHFDVFVIASFTEGLPISLLEAMQAGTPVVSTDVGDIPCVLDNGRCGHLVIKGSVESLAGSLVEVFNDRIGSREMAKAARKRVLEKYSVKVMAESYTEIYNRLYFKKINVGACS